MTLLLTIIMNALVGACIGLTGIAGFLLPMFYAGFLGLTPIESLALSFAAFIVSGILGCPAAIGYFAGGSIGIEVWTLLPAALIAHGVGVLVGAANAHRIDAAALKTIVAGGSILIALIKLVQLIAG